MATPSENASNVTRNIIWGVREGSAIHTWNRTIPGAVDREERAIIGNSQYVRFDDGDTRD